MIPSPRPAASRLNHSIVSRPGELPAVAQADAPMPESRLRSSSAPVVRYLDDPDLYRPATPILNWQGPKRSLKPPKMQLWLFLTALHILSMVLAVTIPMYTMSKENAPIFTSCWIAFSALLITGFTFMSTTRHLHELVMLMESINTPLDMDRVVESLQNGRFSRFEETWKVQVHIIKMFCRLLKYHHGVHPVTNKRIPYSNAGWPGASRLASDGGEDDPMAGPSDVYLDIRAQDSQDADPKGGDSPSLYSLGSSDDGEVPFDGDGAPNVTPTLVESPTHDRLSAAFPSTRDKVRRPVARAAGPVRQPSRSQLEPVKRATPMYDADPLNDNKASWDTALGPETDANRNRSLLLQVLRNVKIGSDLSKIPLPVDILEPRSLLEKLSDMFVHPTLFGCLGAIDDPMERAIAVMRWCVSGFHVRPKGPRKPYNPILGETFDCVFAGGTVDEVRYVAEQVSHHPPASNFYATHLASGTFVVGSFWPKGKLVSPNCGATMGDGRVTLHVPAQRETYELTWPSFFCTGLLKTPVRLEIGGQIKLQASSGINGVLEFVRKPWFGGEYDTIKGHLCAAGSKMPSYVIQGVWHSVTTIQRTEQAGLSGVAETLFNTGDRVPLRPTAHPTPFKKPSRVVWVGCTKALRAKNAKEAQLCKEEIEANERLVRTAREARGEEWLPALFRLVDTPKRMQQATWAYIGPSLQSQPAPSVSEPSPSRSPSPAASPTPTATNPLPLPKVPTPNP